MPELPEVENFRRLLLPLVSTEHPLELERCSVEKSPPRKFISDDEMSDIQDRKMMVSDVIRKGKLICMVLNEKQKNVKKYLFLHMGMTGRISTPECIPKLKELSDTESYPPPYTYLRLSAGPNQACFSDPRKFGAVYLKDVSGEDFGVLAPDAWKSTRTWKVKKNEDSHSHEVADESTITNILKKIAGQSMGIKGVLLDQKRAVCGVGNWVADEVLYQIEMHPDQNYLTQDEAKTLLERLHEILDTAVQCLYDGKEFPEEWLFHYRWSKRKKVTVKDAHGRSIVFVTSGGRTSAVVPSIQKKKSRKPVASTSTTPSKNEKTTKNSAANKKRTTAKTEPELKAVPSEVYSNTISKKAKLTKKGKTTSTKRATTKKESGVRNGASTIKSESTTVRGSTRRSPRLAKC